MLNKSELVAIRDYKPEDRNFILATWLRGLRYGNDWFNLIDKTAYFESYHKVIEALITSPTVYIKVACLKDDPEVILGYSVLGFTGKRSLHWVFCKKAWRGIGIAKQLVPSDVSVVTHLTTTGRVILARHQDVKFNPFFN